MSHHFINTVADTVLICSVAHTLLPPWDALSDFPTAQKYYKVFIYTIGYIALNGRSTVYKSISTQPTSEPATGVSSTLLPPPPAK